MGRMGNQTMNYHRSENENMKEEEAGKVDSETKIGEKTELGNPSGKKGKIEVSVINKEGGESK